MCSVTLAKRITDDLSARGTPARAVAEKAYLKSDLKHLGVSVPQIRTIVRTAVKAKPALSHAELLEAVEALWKRRVHESRMAAMELLAAKRALLVAGDLGTAERLIREAKTWALVDPLAAVVVGDLVERFPKLTRTLDRWSTDDDFWIRRAAMLSLLGPLRKGAGDFARFAGYADAMLDEREFFIRKAIGWILREASRKQPKLVFDWLAPRASRASGVTIREAVKYLSAAQRRKLAASRPTRSRRH
jgi:3-methyladenine DNA glycosylase AlkD